MGEGRGEKKIAKIVATDERLFSETSTMKPVSAVSAPSPDEFRAMMEVAKFRSKGRVPALCWLHPQTSASITRSGP